MKKVLAFGLLALAFSGSPALAQSKPKAQKQSDQAKKDAEYEKLKAQVEMAFSQALRWDEGKNKFVLRDELKGRLPVNPAMVENMLNSIVSNVDGKPKITNDARFKQMLPLLRNFMKQGQREIEKLQKLPPKQREESLKKLGERLGKRKPAKKDPKRTPKRPQMPKFGPKMPFPQPKGGLEGRIQQLEMQIKLLEQMFRQRFNVPPQVPELDQVKKQMKQFQMQARLWSELMKQNLKQQFGDDWKKELKKKFPNLGDVPELPEMDLDGLGKNAPGVGAVRDISRGLKRLNEMLTPEDWMRIQRLAQTLSSTLEPDDFSDQAEVMRKLQGALNPGDMERFLEILSDFVETEEGEAMEARLEKGLQAFEEFMESDRGRNMMEAMKELAKRFKDSDQRSLEKFDRFFGKKPGQKMQRPGRVKKAKAKRNAKRSKKAKLY